jgi:hypothetical protein
VRTFTSTLILHIISTMGHLTEAVKPAMIGIDVLCVEKGEADG